jgi:hypothetical protein
MNRKMEDQFSNLVIEEEEEEEKNDKLKILITNDCELQLEMIKYQF